MPFIWPTLYVFDPAGNRTSQTIDTVTTTFGHNEASQLVSETATGRSATHEYDEWGNEIERVEGTTTETYGYNYLNQMSYYANSTTSAEWQYDFWPTGERYAKTNLTTDDAELYIPRAGDVATEYDKPDGGAITFKNRYVQGIGIDQKQTRISSEGERRHYLGDQVGTVDVTLTDAGAVAESGLKDAWGVQLAGGTPSERYGFSQRERDDESGLMYYRARIYDLRTGRLSQRDSMLRNKVRQHYKYSRNNPLRYVDPTGLQDVPLSQEQIDAFCAKAEAESDYLLFGGSGLPDRLHTHWREGSGDVFELTDAEMAGTVMASSVVKAIRSITEEDMRADMRSVNSGALKREYTSLPGNRRPEYFKPACVLDRSPDAQCFYSFHYLEFRATYEGVVSEIPNTDVLRFDGAFTFQIKDHYGFQNRQWTAIPGESDIRDFEFWVWEKYDKPESFPVKGSYQEVKYYLLAGKDAPQPEPAQGDAVASYDSKSKGADDY